MADQRLNIIFSGDASQLDKTIAQTEAQLQGLNSKLKTSVSGDTFKQATDGVAKFEAKLGGLTTGSIAQLRRAAALLKNELSNLTPAALQSPLGKGLSDSLVLVNTELKTLEKQAAITGATTSGAFNKAFQGVRQLANILPGIGIAGLFGLAASAVNSLAGGFFEAAFGATKFDKALDDAAGSISKESAGIVTMVKALQSGTLSSIEFKRVKAELIAQAPEFQKSFDGDKINIEASDTALTKYINKLTTTVRVTAALSIVNDTLAKSIKAIAKGEDFSIGEALGSFFESGLNGFGALEKTAEKSGKNVQKAIDNLKPENISKLLDDTFKKLGISFNDFAETIDDKALKAKLDKIKADFEKFQIETISKARQFVKEFGDAFVVPNLDDSFFKTKQELFKQSAKLLSDVKAFVGGDQSALKIKLPVLITTETKVNTDDLKKFLRGEISQSEIRTQNITVPVVTDLDFKLAESLEKSFEDFQDNVIKRGIEGLKLEAKIPLEVTIDDSLSKANIAAIDKKLDLRKQFGQLGKIGFDAFNKIDFSNINKGLDEATKKLQQMLALANTLAQSIGTGLSNAFNNVFDAVLQGKSVFKALGESVKALVVDTIKAVVQMFILRAVTNAIFPGAGGITAGTGGLGRLIGGVSGHSLNPSFGSAGGLRMAVDVTGNLTGRGTDLVGTFTQGIATIRRAG